MKIESGKKALVGAAAVGAGALAGAVRRRAARPLRSRVALVTGGSRGLGLAIAQELGSAGCRVCVCARDAAEVDRAVAALSAAGIDVLGVVCDVAVRDQVDSLVRRIVDHFGTLDIVVNNAGVIQVGPIDSLTVDNFREAMEAIFWGTVHTTLAALPHLRGRGGRIVNITSIGGAVSVPHLMPYSAAKFAAVGFSEGLRAEASRYGIRVTTVVPGLMRTGSDVQAEFTGDAKREYAWFAVAAAIPGMTVGARRAARQIVRAMRTGRSRIVLTLPAKVAVLAHGVAPAATQAVLAGVGRLLPGPDGAAPGRTVPGRVAAGDAPRLVGVLSTLNRRAGDDLNQPRPAGPGG